MYTRSNGLIKNDPSGEPNTELGASVSTAELSIDIVEETSDDLIDLNLTVRSNITNQLDIIPFYFNPEFPGESESDLATFISKRDFVFSKIPEILKTGILAAVLTQLKGKAFEAVRYRHITTWEELKLHLRTIYGTSHLVQYQQT